MEDRLVSWPLSCGASVPAVGASVSSNVNMFACVAEGCSERFESDLDLAQHFETHHITSSADKFACSVEGCSEKFKSHADLAQHFETHSVASDANMFVCSQEGCSKEFGSDADLAQHLATHHLPSSAANLTLREASCLPREQSLTKREENLRAVLMRQRERKTKAIAILNDTIAPLDKQLAKFRKDLARLTGENREIEEDMKLRV